MTASPGAAYRLTQFLKKRVYPDTGHVTTVTHVSAAICKTHKFKAHIVLLHLKTREGEPFFFFK